MSRDQYIKGYKNENYQREIFTLLIAILLGTCEKAKPVNTSLVIL